MSALGPKNLRPTADTCAAKSDVRFAPNSDRKSRFSQTGHVCFTAERGRVRRKSSCLLWARSGQTHLANRSNRLKNENDLIIGAHQQILRR
jgi:hypothetical protein